MLRFRRGAAGGSGCFFDFWFLLVGGRTDDGQTEATPKNHPKHQRQGGNTLLIDLTRHRHGSALH